MKKKLWFTVDGRIYDDMNGIKKYRAFQYDTTNGELKFIDVFEDEIKEISLGTASVVSSATSGTTSGTTSGVTSGATSGTTSGTTSGVTSGTTEGDDTTSGTVSPYKRVKITNIDLVTPSGIIGITDVDPVSDEYFITLEAGDQDTWQVGDNALLYNGTTLSKLITP